MGVPVRSATQVLAWACVAAAALSAVLAGAPQTAAPATGADRMVTEADCTAPSLVATIAPTEDRRAGAKRHGSGRVGRGHRHRAGALPRRRRVGAGRYRRHGAADQLPRDPAGVVESPCRATRRRRDQRRHSEPDRRRVRRGRAVAPAARLRDLRQRLGPSAAGLRSTPRRTASRRRPTRTGRSTTKRSGTSATRR